MPKISCNMFVQYQLSTNLVQIESQQALLILLALLVLIHQGAIL